MEKVELAFSAPSTPACFLGRCRTAVINGQTFQQWFVDTYMFNAVGSSPLVSGFFWVGTGVFVCGVCCAEVPQ
jgi:hypothetical protein